MVLTENFLSIVLAEELEIGAARSFCRGARDVSPSSVLSNSSSMRLLPRENENGKLLWGSDGGRFL